MTAFAHNLRTLCSYGRSTSDICRRLGFNRQQFDRYLTGQTQPSLSSLRRICDFFGVDEAEILLEPRAFTDLVRLRPPRLGAKPGALETRIAQLIDRQPATDQLLERHQGYYHVYASPDPARRYLLRTLCRISRIDGAWLTKTIEIHGAQDFAVPSPLRFAGIAADAHDRIVIHERELGRGRGVWSTILIASDHVPNFLPGIVLGISPEGPHEVSATRTVWQFLGRHPDIRAALRDCGVIDPDDPKLAEYVRQSRLADQEPKTLGLIF